VITLEIYIVGDRVPVGDPQTARAMATLSKPFMAALIKEKGGDVGLTSHDLRTSGTAATAAGTLSRSRAGIFAGVGAVSDRSASIHGGGAMGKLGIGARSVRSMATAASVSGAAAASSATGRVTSDGASSTTSVPYSVPVAPPDMQRRGSFTIGPRSNSSAAARAAAASAAAAALEVEATSSNGGNESKSEAKSSSTTATSTIPSVKIMEDETDNNNDGSQSARSSSATGGRGLRRGNDGSRSARSMRSRPAMASLIEDHNYDQVSVAPTGGTTATLTDIGNRSGRLYQIIKKQLPVPDHLRTVRRPRQPGVPSSGTSNLSATRGFGAAAASSITSDDEKMEGYDLDLGVNNDDDDDQAQVVVAEQGPSLTTLRRRAKERTNNKLRKLRAGGAMVDLAALDQLQAGFSALQRFKWVLVLIHCLAGYTMPELSGV
jgi:hypothetical protein